MKYADLRKENRKAMNKERLIAFTDAITAIIITILVLELKKPTAMTLEAFWRLRSNFFAYALSFFWLAAMWVILHIIWNPVKKIDLQVTWVTLIMLFFSSLLPYATSVVASNFNSVAAQVFYGIIVIAITLLNRLSYHMLSSINKDNDNFFRCLSLFDGLHTVDLAVKFAGLAVSIIFWPPAMSIAVLLTLLLILVHQLRPDVCKQYDLIEK